MARRWVVAFAKQHPPEDDGVGETAGTAPGRRSRPQREVGSGGRSGGSGSGRTRAEARAARSRRATAAVGVSKGVRSRQSGRAALPPRPRPRRFGDLPSNSSDEGGSAVAGAPADKARRTRGRDSAGRSGRRSSSSDDRLDGRGDDSEEDDARRGGRRGGRRQPGRSGLSESGNGPVFRSLPIPQPRR